MKTRHVPSGIYELGWRHTLSVEAKAGIDSFLPSEAYMAAFSPARSVVLSGFEIQVEPLDVETLLGTVDDEVLESVTELEQLCDVLDGLLAPSGWRVPTEDELEASIGGGVFRWGDEIPRGTPFEPGDFDLHRQHGQGLVLPHDTYNVVVTRSAFKMGDGGSAVCGAYPWPVAWLTLSPCARVPALLIDDLFLWLENASLHPARSTREAP